MIRSASRGFAYAKMKAVVGLPDHITTPGSVENALRASSGKSGHPVPGCPVPRPNLRPWLILITAPEGIHSGTREWLTAQLSAAGHVNRNRAAFMDGAHAWGCQPAQALSVQPVHRGQSITRLTVCGAEMQGVCAEGGGRPVFIFHLCEAEGRAVRRPAGFFETFVRGPHGRDRGEG